MKRIILKYLNHTVTLNQHLINSVKSEYNNALIVTGNDKYKIQFKEKWMLGSFDNLIFKEDIIELIFDGSVCIKLLTH